jgi:hypothetical protein
MKNGWPMPCYELAKKLGWSQSYLSQVFHGYRRPSEVMSEKARPLTRKAYGWWDDAGQAEIQALINKLRRA